MICLRTQKYSLLSLLILIISGCSGITKITDAITKPSARELYSREFKDNLVAFESWNRAYQTALSDSLLVPLPYAEKGFFFRENAVAYSYNIQMQEGEILTVETQKDSISQRVFIDILEFKNGKFNSVETNELGTDGLQHPINDSGIYKVVVQPELMSNSPFVLIINKRPQYAFPVAGKGNAAIQSFWGFERDGGKRSHEGIDIFAKRGTPVIAVTDGTITRTGNSGLGGNQVWQRAGLFGNSIYYAHLDSIVATEGTTASLGDTIGFVGNTGNAAGGPTHLHFGIYKNGAVNPLPFVFQTESVKIAALANPPKRQKIKLSGKANIRQSPSKTGGILGELTANDSVSILGLHKDWLHIKTLTGKSAFLHRSAIGK